ncbi:MAG: TIGR04211 family SH3 domain-containing protein [Gammaproteobacteria bacterium]
MQKTVRSVILLLLLIGIAEAKTVYVTDESNVSLRSQASNKSKILRQLPAGTPLTVLSENKKKGFSQVRLENGMEGFVATRSTTDQPPSRSELEADAKNRDSLQAENASLKAELTALKNALTPGTTLEQSLAAERDQLDRELAEIKRTAADAIQIKQERDDLQERVVNLERDLEQFKLENKALKDSTKQDWFLYGGSVAFIGILFGLILPKIRWRRKSSNWDTF